MYKGREMAKKRLDEVVSVWLRRRGWENYYRPDYWVHVKCVEDSKVQDYTNYGMDLISAFLHEAESLPPFRSVGISEVSKSFHRPEKLMEVLEIYFGEDKEV